MQKLNEAINHIFHLIVIWREVRFYAIAETDKSSADDGLADVYLAYFEDYTEEHCYALHELRERKLYQAEKLSDGRISISVLVEFRGLSDLQELLNKHRSTDVWEGPEEFVRGTILIPLEELDYQFVYLSDVETKFQIDVLSAAQFRDQEAALLAELDLVSRWSVFLRQMIASNLSLEEEVIIRRAAQFVLSNFGSWDTERLDKILTLCSMAGTLETLTDKYPDVFTEDGCD